MILWEREKQCEKCMYEGGCNVVVGGEADGSLIYEYEFYCDKGNNQECDKECFDFDEAELIIK